VSAHGERRCSRKEKIGTSQCLLTAHKVLTLLLLLLLTVLVLW